MKSFFILSSFLFIYSLNSMAAPIGSLLQDTKDGSLFFMVSPKSLESLLEDYRLKSNDKFQLSSNDKAKASKALAEAIMEETKNSQYRLSACYLDQEGLKNLSKTYKDAMILNHKGLKERFTKTLQILEKDCTQEAIRLIEVPEISQEEAIWTIEDTFVDGLKYVASGVSNEKLIVEFENGSKLKILGNIFSISYQDLAQTSKDGKSYASDVTEDGLDLSLIYELNNNIELSATAYLYQYGESHFNADQGKEVSFKLSYKVKDYFKVGLSYHIGKIGEGPDNQYGIGRIIGVYIPKAWR
jgi:hypothetical protein